ncbi:phosphohydrolase [Veronia nyctiphanis]|nr:phosphohydrolase [Veronia nyctiphanis]
MYGEFPFYLHLDQVEKLAEPYGLNAMIVCQLQSLIDDTSTELDEIFSEFGQTIAHAVSYLSCAVYEDRHHRMVKQNETLSTLEGFEESERLALVVKTCDQYVDAKASRVFFPERFAKYQSDYATFRDAVYRPGLCEKVWLDLDRLMEIGTFLGRTEHH